MKWLYRITLIIAGSYFESAIKHVTELMLYWTGNPNAMEGFLPYIVPMLFGYVYALEVRDHWSNSRLKNDIMAYMGSTVLIGYPFYIGISFWIAGGISQTAMIIRWLATGVFAINLLIAALVWRGAVKAGYPFSLPWGPQVGRADEDDDEDEDGGEGVEVSSVEDGRSDESVDAGDAGVAGKGDNPEEATSTDEDDKDMNKPE